MNRIYTVVWNQVRRQYMVVSEFAGRGGKAKSLKGMSCKARLAAWAVCGMLGMLGGIVQAAVTTGDTADWQYAAVAVDKDHPNGSFGIYEDQYEKVTVNGKDYWVRNGYHIVVEQQHRYDSDATDKDGNPLPLTDDVVKVYRDADWVASDGEGLLSSLQLSNSNMNVTTLNGKDLQNVAAGTFVGASSGGGAEVSKDYQYMIYDGGKWIDADLSTDFKGVSYDETLGGYVYMDAQGQKQLIDPNDMYIIDGTAGVFVVNDEIYSGSVYGANNEILVTGKQTDEKGTTTYYSYWGAERNEPNETIGDKLTVGQYNQTIGLLNENIKSVHEDNIKQVQIQDNGPGNGGTIGFQTNGESEQIGTDDDGKAIYASKGGATIPGAITITSVGGTQGNDDDVKVKFSNTINGQESSFTIDGGSKVRANETAEADADTLTTLSVNGVSYKLSEGKAYSHGNGIMFSGDDESEISVNKGAGLTFDDGRLVVESGRGLAFDGNALVVDTAEDGFRFDGEEQNGKLSLNIGDGLSFKNHQLVADLSIAADNDAARNNKNGGNWTITDGNSTFANTTLDVTASKEWNSGEDSLISGTAETSDAGTTYGRNYRVIDTDGNILSLDDVASAKTLQAIAADVNAGWTAYAGDKTVKTVTPDDPNLKFIGDEKYTTVSGTTDGDIQISVDVSQLKAEDTNAVLYDNVDKTSVTLGSVPTGDNVRTPVKLTNVATAATDETAEGYDTTAAVNVELLKDYVSEKGGGAWNLTTNGGTEESDKAVPIGKDATVDFSGVPQTIGEGDEETNQSNIVVNKTTENGTTKVTFDLSDDVHLKKLTVENQYVTNVDETNDNSVTDISYVKSHDYYLRNGNESLGQNSDGTAISYGEGTNAVTKGYKADEHGNIDMTVKNDNGETQHVVLTDIASKKTQDEMQEQLGGVVMYDELPTGGYNTGSVTLGGLHGGDHPYSYHSEMPTTSGGVTLTNVAYAVTDKTDTENYIGSAAVNVDLLKDYVSANSTAYGESLWKLSTNGGMGEENSPVAIGKDATVDFSSADNNLVVSKAQDDESSTTMNVQFKLADDLTLGSRDGNGNSISISGTDGTISLTSGSDSDSNTISIGQGKITGLTNDITSNWETFMQGPQEGKTSYSAATEYELWQLAQHSVQYSLDDKGGIDYSKIVLRGSEYGTDESGHGGGTHLTNVAYATGEDGSEAVNVDYLNDHAGQLVYGNNNIKVTADLNATATNANGGNWTVTDTQGTEDTADDTTFTNTTLDAEASGAVNGSAVVSEDGNTTYGQDYVVKDTDGNTVTIGDVASAETLKAVDEKVGDTQYKHTDGSATTIVTAGDDVTTSIGKLDEAIGGISTDISEVTTEAKKHTTVEAGSNIVVTPGTSQETGGKEYTISVSETPQYGGHDDGNGGTTNGSVTVVGTGEDGTQHTVVVDGATGLMNGLSNTTWNQDVIDAVAADTTGTGAASVAATQGQLKAATEGAVQYDRNEDGSVNKGSITFDGENGTTLKNIAAGEVSATSTQAINGSQLYQRDLAIYNNSQNIQMLSNSVNKLDNRIDRVGAGAAALAALHPLDFDPDAKWDFAAGYGNYRGANAVAVGAYYRPNEDVMFSVGGSMGGGENMVNAGVSLKIGAVSSNVTTSRTAMAKEIKSMRDIVAKQDAQIQKLTAMVNALVGVQTETDTTTMFPDVPENHWAYEAVAAMAKSGLVKGYPDGEFKGDRTMTRYEFAQIVYNAIQAGAEVDARLVEEFKPELEYFHIATVAKDKDGNPTIERVRAN